ncbi:MAG: DUF481 domain-containing protein [Tepidisphaeraceae bacterium]
MGLTGQNGETESAALNTGFALKSGPTITDYSASVSARYFYTNSEGKRSQNALTFQLKRDQYIKSVSDRFFIFGTAQYDFDEFQAFRNRATAFVGPGYNFIKRDNLTLKGRVGIGVADDFGNAETDDFRVEASIGLDGKWTFDDGRQSITYSINYFPSLSNFLDEGRVVTNLAYEAMINRAKGLALKLFVEHKYEFRTLDDTEPTNWRYGANLVLKF